jgi:hypothetical protein
MTQVPRQFFSLDWVHVVLKKELQCPFSGFSS